MYLLFILWLTALVLVFAKPRWAPTTALVTLGATGLWTAIA